MSKGSAPRPFSVANEEYATRWDAIFRRDKPKEDKEPPKEEAVKQEEKEKK